MFRAKPLGISMLWRLQIFIGHKMEWQFARLGQLKQLVRKRGVRAHLARGEPGHSQ